MFVGLTFEFTVSFPSQAFFAGFLSHESTDEDFSEVALRDLHCFLRYLSMAPRFFESMSLCSVRGRGLFILSASCAVSLVAEAIVIAITAAKSIGDFIFVNFYCPL